jgi:hypothetical protein
MSSAVLPSNATEWEKAVADTGATPLARLEQIDAITGTKISQPPADMLPWLVHEYGLGELTPFLTNLYDLIQEGVRWQRIRGTHKAVETALGWLDYTAEIEEEPVRRRRWHLFQLGLDRHRDEYADLDKIEGVTTLSVPARSHFWRGYSFYDVRAVEGDYSKTDDTIWDDWSGVRIRTGGTKWSFGRPHDIQHTLTEEELTPLGLWSDPLSISNTWESVEGTWETEGLTWDTASPTQRLISIYGGLAAKGGYVQFKDSDDNVIGCRRFKTASGIRQSSSGDIEFDGDKYIRSKDAPEMFYIEALTAFDQANGKTATKASIVFDAYPTDITKPGLAWVGPGQMSGDQNIVAADSAVDIEFATTIREQVRFFLTV